MLSAYSSSEPSFASIGPGNGSAEQLGPRALEAELLALINGSRVDASLGELSWDPTAAEAARAHAQEMLDREFFDYTNPEGEGAIERLTRRGERYAYWGENLSLSRSVDTSHRTDMRDERHRENVLDERFERVGIGISRRSDEMLLITVVFLSP